MAGLTWFRLYAEFATDPVVQSLAFDDQRHFVMLMCLKCSGLLDREFGSPQARLDVIRKALGLDGKAWDEMRSRLQAVRLITPDLQPAAWDKRQFLSDNSTERVRQFRMKRSGNVSVTPPETDTDTDTEKTPLLRKGSDSADAEPPQEPANGKDKAEKLPPCPYGEIVAIYHEALPILPRVADLSTKRRGLVSGRWRQVCVSDGLDQRGGLDFFRNYFGLVSKSKFLTGRSKPTGDRPPFVADLEWLMRPTNFLKVIEGRYQ